METKLLMKDGYVKISHSKAGTFKVATVGANNEKINSTEVLNKKQAVMKNIKANLKANHGEFVIIHDLTQKNKEKQWIRLNSDGSTQEV